MPLPKTILRLAGGVLLIGMAFVSAMAEPMPRANSLPGVIVESIGPIGVTVADMDRSVRFFEDVLTFEKASDVEVAGAPHENLQGVFGLRARVVRLRLGDEELELTHFLTPRGRPMPYDSRANDQWFQHVAIIVSDMDRAYARLRARGVEHASTEPQTIPEWNEAAAGIRAFYFRDPDGHFLELLSFPEGKGDAKWHKPCRRLFLGIDHTAIVVKDTEASLRWYRDTLGMNVVGASENHGPEQERLNNVRGARLRITTLRAARGPAVELLEYLTPTDGRMTPSDVRSNDLWHWVVRMETPDIGEVLSAVRALDWAADGGALVSLPSSELGYREGALVRDPDRHTVLLVEKP